MKKVVLIALALIAQPAYSLTGNEWLEKVNSNDSATQLVGFAYFSGIVDVLVLYSGMGKICANVPSMSTTKQAEAIVLKWFEDNPAKRHYEMPIAIQWALTDAYGHRPVNEDGFCK